MSVYSSRFTGSTPAEVVRAAIASLAAARLRRVSVVPARRTSDRVRRGDIRAAIRARTRAASTFGVGPRYLHSTGQYHKGGPNTIVAFVITGEDATETPIPDAPFTFKQLKRAQAVGDYQTLEAHDRRTVRIHFDRGVDPVAGLKTLFA